jgi:hypothetical protein
MKERARGAKSRRKQTVAQKAPPVLQAPVDRADSGLLSSEREGAPKLLSLIGSLRGKITGREFTRLSNEGEDLT